MSQLYDAFYRVIDTETTGLDPNTCAVCGGPDVIYTAGLVLQERYKPRPAAPAPQDLENDIPF